MNDPPVVVPRTRGEEIVLSFWRTLTRESFFWPLCILVVLTLILVSPFGNFPLNDDWAYAGNVREWVEHGRYSSRYMTLALGQTLWGAAFAAVFGVDYSVLRLSTLLLALVTLWVTARCAMRLGASRGMALLAAAAVWANPLFLNLSYSFMSEVHFLAPISLALLFYLRGLQDGRALDIALGSLFAVVATSTRQFGIFVPLAYVATLVPVWLQGTRSFHAGRVAAFALPWILSAAAYLAMPGLENRPPPTTDLSTISLGEALETTWRETTRKLVTLGFFALPLTAGRMLQALRGRAPWTGRQLAAVPWICLLVLPGLMRFEAGARALLAPMPYLGNILHDIGTGPLTLRDTYIMHMPVPVRIGGWWWIPSILSIVSAAVLCVELIPPLYHRFVAWARARLDGSTAEPPDSQRAQSFFVLLCGALFLCAPYHLVMGPGTFDRYLVPAFPPFLILLASSTRRPELRVPATALVLCALLFAFSLACVQDYLAWNRARWAAIEAAEAIPGVGPTQIDAGYEYNGVTTRDEFMRQTGAGPHDWGTKGFWVIDDSYSVSFNPRKGYAEIGRFAYFSWLGMTTRQVLLLQRGG